MRYAPRNADIRGAVAEQSREVARYPYHDAEGRIIYEAVRWEPGFLRSDGSRRDKDFTLERVDPDGRRVTGKDEKDCMKDVPRVPYMLPLLLKGIERGETIWFVEGEKCANALIKKGFVATTRSEGSGANIDDKFVEYFDGAKEIVLCSDCDVPGRQSSVRRARIFTEAGNRAKILDVSRVRSDGYDVADFLEEGNSVEELRRLADEAPIFDPPKIDKQDAPVKGVEAARIFTLADLLHEAVKRAENAVECGTLVQATPWQTLNYALGGGVVHAGFFPGENGIWAATPGGGKSAATWQVADHAAARYEGTAIIASAEMGEIVAAQRLITLYSGVTMAQMNTGKLSSDEWEKIEYVERNLSTRRLAIIGRDGQDIHALHKSIEQIASHGKISCIVIDHIGKISQKNMGESRHYALEAICEEFGKWAVEYNCVVHMIQHLNKKGYGKEPDLQDLRDGGNTDGNANFVIFPYRKFPDSGNVEVKRKGFFLVRKCRDGSTGPIKMDFYGERYMWSSPEENSLPWFERE